MASVQRGPFLYLPNFQGFKLFPVYAFAQEIHAYPLNFSSKLFLILKHYYFAILVIVKYRLLGNYFSFFIQHKEDIIFNNQQSSFYFTPDICIVRGEKYSTASIWYVSIWDNYLNTSSADTSRFSNLQYIM